MTLCFGDFVVTAKPIPNVRLRTEGRVIACAVHRERLCATMAVLDAKSNIERLVGPYPLNAFTFTSSPTSKELDALIVKVSKFQKGSK